MAMGFYGPCEDPAVAADQSNFLDSIRSVVSDEDYAIGFDIQKGMRSGAQHEINLGLNEPGVIYFHEVMRDILTEMGELPAVVQEN